MATNGLVEIREYLYKFNKGNLFDNIKVESSHVNMTTGKAKTSYVKSVTGDEFGSDNIFLQVDKNRNDANGRKPNIDDLRLSDFVANDTTGKVKKRVGLNKKEDGELVGGNLIVPPSLNPPPPKQKLDENVSKEKSLFDEWLEHQEKRRSAIHNGISQTKVDEMGLQDYTFDQYKQKFGAAKKASGVSGNVVEDEMQKQMLEENKAKRVAMMRFSRDLQAYHNQGSQANIDGFNIGKKPSILQIKTDDLRQVMLMFSPEWLAVNGSSKVSDDELALAVDAQDKEAMERLRKAKEAEEAKKKEEEMRKKREQEILDYSAKVSGGFIEVKIGEDVQAMQDAWYAHQTKRQEAIHRGIS